jgi:Na+/alanine symporter
MMIPNLIAVIVLAPVAIALLNDFARRYKELSG